MARFDNIIATALRLIKKNGQSVTFSQLTDGAPADPLKPWKPSEQTNVDYTVDIAFFTSSLQTRKFLQYLTGTEVPEGNLIGYMGQVSFEPKIKDIVIRDGVELTIRDFDLISPNGQKVLYILEFEK